MTIMEAILSLAGFTGTSIAGGITWDLLKLSGVKIIQSFKNKFGKGDKKYFRKDDDCESFLKDLLEKNPNSKKNPYKDVRNIYEDYTDTPDDSFIGEFKEWIEDNKDNFEQMKDIILQTASVRINTQINTGSGKIVNAGIINNNYG